MENQYQHLYLQVLPVIFKVSVKSGTTAALSSSTACTFLCKLYILWHFAANWLGLLHHKYFQMPNWCLCPVLTVFSTHGCASSISRSNNLVPQYDKFCPFWLVSSQTHRVVVHVPYHSWCQIPGNPSLFLLEILSEIHKFVRVCRILFIGSPVSW